MEWHEAQAPDVVGRIVACRLWRLDGYIIPQLRSTGVSYRWRAGQQEAVCLGSPRDIHRSRSLGLCNQVQGPVVQRSCGCGFWGLTSWSRLGAEFGMQGRDMRQSSHEYPGCVGLVEMWGRVVPGVYGWRAQYAQITALANEPLASLHGVAHLTELDDRVLTPPFHQRQEAS
jgi:hypothetical protein